MASGGIADASRIGPISMEIKFRTIDSTSLNSSSYRNEGNTTLVVSLPNEKKVLKLRKFDPNGGDKPSEDDGENRVRLAVDFHRNVMSGLMGVFANEPEIVRCNNEDLKAQLKIYEPDRPAKRRWKTVIETFATTLPDYTLLPADMLETISLSPKRSTFCIEIKPKEGYVSNSPFNTMCQYCSSHFPYTVCGLSSLSGYCPRNLFSGQHDRIIRALEGLFNFPRNNFRIFKDGKLVWGEEFESSRLDEILGEWFDAERTIKDNRYDLIELLHEALLRSFRQSKFVSSISSKSSNSAIVKNLPIDSVLGRIHRVQTLYRCRVDEIYPTYSKYSEILNDEMVYNLETNVDNEKLNNQDNSQKREMPSLEELKDLQNYLVYRIAKDCSILIAFREIYSDETRHVPSENVIELSGKRFFLFNNAITDLDPKSVHCIEKHRRAFFRPKSGLRPCNPNFDYIVPTESQKKT